MFFFNISHVTVSPLARGILRHVNGRDDISVRFCSAEPVRVISAYSFMPDVYFEVRSFRAMVRVRRRLLPATNYCV